jgi:hypothetical protein
VTQPHARRTSRLQGLVCHLGLALGGRPAQALAERLLLPVSKDTFLRSVRAAAEEIVPEPRVTWLRNCSARSRRNCRSYSSYRLMPAKGELEVADGGSGKGPEAHRLSEGVAARSGRTLGPTPRSRSRRACGTGLSSTTSTEIARISTAILA